MKFNILSVEEKIKIPREQWRGKCHKIAALMLKYGLVKGKLRYGHWTGSVSKSSMFEDYPHGLVRHGWIELPNGQIVDPTRFELEQKPPYIYVGRNDYYDAGGNQFRIKNMRPAPPFNSNEKSINLILNNIDAIKFIETSLDRKINNDCVVISTGQAFWLANLPLQVLGKACKPVYSALIHVGLGALIPIDNRELAFENEGTAAGGR